jgi:hypothetical protein
VLTRITHLDQVVTTVTAPRVDQRIDAFFEEALHEVSVVEHRRETFCDLDAIKRVDLSERRRRDGHNATSTRSRRATVAPCADSPGRYGN